MVEPAIAPAFRFWDLLFLPCWVTRILSANRQSQLPYALEPHQQQMRSRLRRECYDFDMRRNVRGLRDVSTLRWRQQFLTAEFAKARSINKVREVSYMLKAIHAQEIRESADGRRGQRRGSAHRQDRKEADHIAQNVHERV